MNNPMADDLFEIYGNQIELSSIKNYRLRQVEFLLRPVYAERQVIKKGILGRNSVETRIEFAQMEYYAAVIDETKYKNAIEEQVPFNMAEAVVKTVVEGVTGVVNAIFGSNQRKKIVYHLMSAAERSFYRSYEDIPAVLVRYDGKRSEVFRNDELYSKLGEPIAPTIEKIPAMEIITNNGAYLFFGKGIQLKDIEGDYERLKRAFEIQKQRKLEQQKNGNIFNTLFGWMSPQNLPDKQASVDAGEAGKKLPEAVENKDSTSGLDGK